MHIDIPDTFWPMAGTVLGAAGMIAGLLRYGARIMIWGQQLGEPEQEDQAKKAFGAVEVLERRMYFERTETERRLDTMERTFATKDELAAVEQRLSGAVGDLREDVRELGRHIASHSMQTTENLHRLIGDVAEIKGHLGKGAYKQPE